MKNVLSTLRQIKEQVVDLEEPASTVIPYHGKKYSHCCLENITKSQIRESFFLEFIITHPVKDFITVHLGWDEAL